MADKRIQDLTAETDLTGSDIAVDKAANAEAKSFPADSLALKNNVLELDNTTPFTPTADFHPATKEYVDDNIPSAGTYDALTDTPGTKSGQALELVRVNAGETAHEYVPAASVPEIAAKADKISVPTDGNVLQQDATGNIEDTGIAATNVALKNAGGSPQTFSDEVQFDSVAWSAISVITFASIINLDLTSANSFEITLTGNITSLTATGFRAGATHIILIKQDGVGGHTVTLGAGFDRKMKGDSDIDTTANKDTLITIFSDGSITYYNYTQEF